MKVLSVLAFQIRKDHDHREIIAELRERVILWDRLKIFIMRIAIDTKGSNTDRHRRAGAQLVTARGLHETDILYGGEQLPIEKYWGGFMIMILLSWRGGREIQCSQDNNRSYLAGNR